MNIPFVPADSSNFYSGRGGNSIKYIVMHYTANDGDTDEGNAHYFQGAGRRASAHYFVDEDSVTQHGIVAAISRARITRYAAFV